MADETTTEPDILEAFGLEAPSPPPAEEEPAPETTEEPAKATKPDKPEEEWTPDRIAAEKKKVADSHAKLAKRQAGVERKLAEMRAERERAESGKAALSADATALLKGDSRAILSTLARLTGRDPVELYRGMGEALVADGRGEESDELAEVKRQLAELADERKREAEARKAAAAQAQNVQQAQNALHGYVQDSERFPELAAYSEANGALVVGRQVWSHIANQLRAGKRADVVSACVEAERALRKSDWRSKGAAPPGAPAPKAAGASENAAGGPPVKAERVGATPGSSLSPTTAARTSGNNLRPLTDDERRREASKLIPGLLKELGFH